MATKVSATKSPATKTKNAKPKTLAVVPELSDDERHESFVANVRSTEGTARKRIAELYEWLHMLAWSSNERSDRSKLDEHLDAHEFIRALGHVRALESEVSELADTAARDAE